MQYYPLIDKYTYLQEIEKIFKIRIVIKLYTYNCHYSIDL